MERHGLNNDFYVHVAVAERRGDYGDLEALAIDFAERFCVGQPAFADDFWGRLTTAFSPDHLVELAAHCAKWLGLGRLNAGGRVYLIGARPELVTARGFSQYAASKAALARAAEIARLEHRGVGITLVLPPAVDTALWAQVGRVPKGAVTPDVVARAIAAHRAAEPTPELRVD